MKRLQAVLDLILALSIVVAVLAVLVGIGFAVAKGLGASGIDSGGIRGLLSVCSVYWCGFWAGSLYRRAMSKGKKP